MVYCLSSMHAAGNLSLGVYCYTSNLLALRAAVSPAVILPSECSVITPPLKPDVWDHTWLVIHIGSLWSI